MKQKSIFDQLMNTMDRANNLALSLYASVEPEDPFTSDEKKEEYRQMVKKIMAQCNKINENLGYF